MSEIMRVDNAWVDAETGEVMPELLDDLAEAINREHEACEKAATSALEHAMNAGDYLAEAKEQAGHGNWLSWLETNFNGSERQARRYIHLAKNRVSLEANRTRVSDLSIRAALKELANDSESDSEEYEDAEAVVHIEEPRTLEDVQAELAQSGMTLQAVPEHMAAHVGDALNLYSQDMAAKEKKQERRETREKERGEAEEKMESYTLDERVQIVHADFRDALSDIPEGSADLILTDPPYPAEYVERMEPAKQPRRERWLWEHRPGGDTR